MSIVGVYGVIPLEFLKSVVPLGGEANDSEIDIELGHAKGVGTGFLECGDNLLVFVAVRVHREALCILKNEAKSSVLFGKGESAPHGLEDVSRLRAQPVTQFRSLATPCLCKEDRRGLDTRASILGQDAGSSRKILRGM
jgi:hypothetical protein